jgi:hypothetical protein
MKTRTAPPALDTLPRTIRMIVEAIATIAIGDVRAELRWYGPTSFDVLVPQRYIACDEARTRTVKLLNVARVGWYTRDGRHHLGGGVADAIRAIENIREGKNAQAPRREITGLHTGRDAQGRFVADTTHATR